jgi:hypothetical protein
MHLPRRHPHPEWLIVTPLMVWVAYHALADVAAIARWVLSLG